MRADREEPITGQSKPIALMARRTLADLGVAAVFMVGAACGGVGTSDNTTTTTGKAPLVRNRLLDHCVDVQSGQRPTRPQTGEEEIAQREAEIAALPPVCRPKR